MFEKMKSSNIKEGKIRIKKLSNDVMKENKKKEKFKSISKIYLKKINHIIILLIGLIQINLFIYLSKEDIIESEITTINKNGEQKLINNNSYIKPSQYIINNNTEDYQPNYDLTRPENTIIIKFDYEIINCNLMFYNLKDIKKIDFSKFKSSKVRSMFGMFYNCISLESIDFTNFDIHFLLGYD